MKRFLEKWFRKSPPEVELSPKMKEAAERLCDMMPETFERRNGLYYLRSDGRQVKWIDWVCLFYQLGLNMIARR